jgi:AraC-like DNA-binding protein
LAAIISALTLGKERWTSHSELPRHRHRQGYICLVVSGGFEEAGDCGRRSVGAGDVNCHGPFEAHCDRFKAHGAETLNFDFADWTDLPSAFCRVRDPDLIVRTAERDREAAVQLLLSSIEPAPCAVRDWPDELAQDLRCQPDTCLGEWAEQRHLDPATVSRGFRRIYDISPSTFRMQLRARRAWRSLMHSDMALVDIAAEHGFADQPHMTRAVGALTGRSPSHWRRLRSNAFKTRMHRSATLRPWTNAHGTAGPPCLEPC